MRLRTVCRSRSSPRGREAFGELLELCVYFCLECLSLLGALGFFEFLCLGCMLSDALAFKCLSCPIFTLRLSV